MTNQETAEYLNNLLEVQLQRYKDLHKMQTSIIELFKEPIQFHDLMNLLKHKENLVSQIASASALAKPYVAEWMQISKQEKAGLEAQRIDAKLDGLTKLVEEIRTLDEKMIALLNPPRDQKKEDPQDLLNAYRALR